MSEEEIDRKITIIFATDVVGYSKHMEADESETVKNLRACEKLLTGLFKKHKGRLFNTGGDSFLAEFSSAVSAVECAVEFQKAIEQRNSTEDATVELKFRIGINSGDVIKEKDNLLGDGVNIAARLEALAQSGGITISKSVYDYVKGKTQHEFNDLGLQKVKLNEFHAFDIILTASQKRTLNSKSPKQLHLMVFAIFVVLTILFGGYVYNVQLAKKDGTEEISYQETSTPIILVAPIKASGLESEIKSFADGVTESMISAFSTFKGVKVLSSNTSFHTIEQKMTDEEIRAQFGVKFIVRGSIQVMGQNARLNLEVTNIPKAEVVAAKKRDFELNKIFSVQDEMSSELLSLMQIDLGVGKYANTFAQHFNSVEDLTIFLNWIRIWRGYSKEGHQEAQDLFEQLKKKYPEENTNLYVMEAWQLQQKLAMQLSSNPDKDRERLKFVINRAPEFDNDSADAFNARALINLTMFDGTCEEAFADMKQAEMNGQNQETLLIGSAVYRRCGDKQRAIESLKQLLEMVPNDPGWFQTGILVTILYEVGQYDEIYKAIGKKIDAKDMDNRVLAIYAVLAAKKGNKAEATTFFERSLNNGFRWDRFRDFEEPLLKETLDTLEDLAEFDRGD
jgi:TolB-like protein